jgi:hypothetical protein
MRTARQIAAWMQLTRLFLKQFLENDLVAPDSDRAQLLSVLGAGVVSLTLFSSMFLSAPYAMSVLTPGEAAVRTLNDKFFYVSLAMLITALVAAAQWDTLALDHRDSAILDPLPVRPSIVRLAKLAAVAMLGAAVALAVNICPTWVFPWMVSFSLRQMSAGDVFRMMATHAMITVTAAVFGYLAVMALRESLSAVLGPRLFARVSPTLQATTIVVLGSLLLLLPPASTRIAERGFSGWRAQSPPMAFVAAYEVASRPALADLPRRRANERMHRRDLAATEIYEARRPLFLPMAQRMEGLFLVVVAALAVAMLINGFRAPVGGALLQAGGRRRARMLNGIANTLIVRHPAARAGFHFAVATLFRSKTHRLTLACAAAVGLAMTMVVLSRVELQSGTLTGGLLAVQPLLYGSLLVGFRHLVRVPAELRANWGVQLAWRDNPRAFRNGVFKAGILALALPAVMIVVPLVALLSDPATAMWHAAIGLGGAIVFLEMLMIGYDKAPFTCSYVPGSAKGVLPVLAIAFLAGASLFGRLQLSMLRGESALAGAVLLLVVFGGLRIASMRRRDPQMDFNEGPETFNQLGLHT